MINFPSRGLDHEQIHTFFFHGFLIKLIELPGPGRGRRNTNDPAIRFTVGLVKPDNGRSHGIINFLIRLIDRIFFFKEIGHLVHNCNNIIVPAESTATTWSGDNS